MAMLSRFIHMTTMTISEAELKKGSSLPLTIKYLLGSFPTVNGRPDPFARTWPDSEFQDNR
jgi:hypothetical protein